MLREHSFVTKVSCFLALIDLCSNVENVNINVKAFVKPYVEYVYLLP